jgi:hypothetical protein
MKGLLMIAKQRKAKRVIYIGVLLLSASIFFIFIYIKASLRTLVFKGDYTPFIRGDNDLKGELYKLSAGKYLLVLSKVSVNKVDGYYIDLSAKKMGFANFSPKHSIRITSHCAFVDDSVFEMNSELYELDATYQKEANDWVITLNGPSKNAIDAEPGAQSFYTESIIYNKTIVLKKNRLNRECIIATRGDRSEIVN